MALIEGIHFLNPRRYDPRILLGGKAVLVNRIGSVPIKSLQGKVKHKTNNGIKNQSIPTSNLNHLM